MTFAQIASVTVNGSTIESGYVLKNADMIVAKNLWSDIGSNPPDITVSEGTGLVGTTYTSTQTISLSNQNIYIWSDSNSWEQITLTINFSIT